ncbi:MAG: TetR/AcrR family transcriptional regulator, partial [Actinobacteria bacterium]|nr:TetR/AcrR family transcriptional regulator [Actinomycetota bacterium]
MSRRDEIIEAAYAHVLTHGLTGASLRPVAEAVGSSTGVLRFLFESKDGLVAALLDRARQDELELLAALPEDGDFGGALGAARLGLCAAEGAKPADVIA